MNLKGAAEPARRPQPITEDTMVAWYIACGQSKAIRRRQAYATPSQGKRASLQKALTSEGNWPALSSETPPALKLPLTLRRWHQVQSYDGPKTDETKPRAT